MSRGRKLTKAEKRIARHRRDSDDVRLDALVMGTAQAIHCSTEAAYDAAAECARRREDLAHDLAHRRLALELWSGRPGREALTGAMTDLIAETERHHGVLRELEDRFDALSRDTSHEHLGTPEDHYDLVRRRLFDEPPPNVT